MRLPGDEKSWFRTGDRVRRLPDGNLTFVARADFQVKVRGHRVELEEVETALLSLGPVEEAAVVAVEDGEGSSALHAAVVTGLPAYSVPAEISTLGSLPRTPTGKIDRKALRSTLTEEHADDGE